MHVKASVFAAVCCFTSLIAACGSSGPPDTTGVDDGSAASGNAGGNGGTEGGSGGGAGGAPGGTFGFIDDGPDAGGGSACRTVSSCVPGECGPVADGCNGLVDCGGCEAPETCGGSGVSSRCGIPGTSGTGGTGNGTCTPQTCADLGVECGTHGDGCGNQLNCNQGNCSGSEQCQSGQCVDACPTRLTCADYAGQTGLCGQVSDGCSGTLDCGFTCTTGQFCGLGGPGVCGTPPPCVPDTCEEALVGKPAGYCGFVSDGCEGELVGCATTCTAPETCGGGGGVDGGSPLEVCGQGQSCTLLTCADYNGGAGLCGPVSDGCGGTLSCGFVCDTGAGEVCGLVTGGQCDTPTCTPRDCGFYGADCGDVEDGCGGTINCGSSCPVSGDTCGGGGPANVCGQPACTTETQEVACAGKDCGIASDGCDDFYTCGDNNGDCVDPETCGAGGPSLCGDPCPNRLTVADCGTTCGSIGDNCSGSIDCGGCADGFDCQGSPGQCVATVPCDNYCQQQATCTAGSETRITGTVYAPNGTEPLSNALVYVPNIDDLDDLPAITNGPTCERCEDEDLGDPLVAAITGPDGSFSLDNVPSTVDFPLVVKMGKWRRVVWVPAVADCSNNPLISADTRLPRHMNDADLDLIQHVSIPQFAMVTGEVDAIECVLRKIGLSDNEFTGPSGSGRVHIYRGDNNGDSGGGSNGASISGSTTRVGTLLTNNTLDNYDVAIFDCEGPSSKTDAWRTAVETFANAGGRVFASHYSYNYLEGNTSFDGTATWNGNEYGEAGGFFGAPVNNNPTTGIIDTSHSKGQAFNAWLGEVDAHHATHGDGYISIIDPRGYVASVTPGITEQFVFLDANAVAPNGADINDYSSVQQYAFNTPVGAAPEAACGRVVYSAFHVSGAVPGVISNFNSDTFPAHCDTGALTAQEKALEYMIFDLSSCVSVSVPPSCQPRSCESVGANCGYLSDGCGGLLDCGAPCDAPETCGGGGTPNQCGSSCTLTSCSAEGANCGIIGDGCGGQLNCGACVAPATCGGGGIGNVCGTPACTPRSCASVSAECGSLADGCGGTLNCGTCTAPESCGGAGTPNQCGQGTCSPQDCGDVGANCGLIGDGCGGEVNCGTCAPGAICGQGGLNQCGVACTPRTCQEAGANCGLIGDGCAGRLNCGDCSEGLSCGGGGTPNVCGGTFCQPQTCEELGAVCGAVVDACGNTLSCGNCPGGQVCGAVTANQCDPGSCTPGTCGGSDCGIISDGCSGALDCGPCGSCLQTCEDQDADCGFVGDGCGGSLDCGTCSVGSTCVANQCNSIQ